MNNILLGGGGVGLRISGDSLSGLVSNDNVVGSLFQSDDTGDTETLAQWQSQTGQDKNSLAATPAQLFVNPSGSNFQELSTSPSIGAGTSTDAPSADILGNPRPGAKGYDIGCYEYEAGASAPAVIGETPASGATGVAVSATATATFNQAVVAGTIDFTLDEFLRRLGGGNCRLQFHHRYRDLDSDRRPWPMEQPTRPRSAALRTAPAWEWPAPFTWSFTTDAKAPAVTSESPANGATGVAVSTTVTATFNEAVQAGTIVLTLKNSSGGSVGATVAYNSATKTASLTPSVALAYGTTYTATVSGALDTAGDPMPAPVTWSFTTDLTTPILTTESPSNGATGVALSSPVTAIVQRGGAGRHH